MLDKAEQNETSNVREFVLKNLPVS